MIIGIDGSRAFLQNRTGIEEYSYRVIKNLTIPLEDCQVVLYLRNNRAVDFNIPKSWRVKVIRSWRLWTQIGLSLEMILHPVDVLFIPAHTVPFIHPKHTVVTIHGLEYEFVPQGYSRWARFYMRWTIRKSCQWASEIIAVSENTKKDLMRLYGVDEKKLNVIYEGYDSHQSSVVSQSQSVISHQERIDYRLPIADGSPYLFFVGRIEERKNISNIVKAFEILKEQYQILHKLLLAGGPGFGFERIKSQISNCKSHKDIIELGYVSDKEKFALMKNADAFVFPTLYEGFGIPILEAQSVGCAVVAGNNSSIPEVVTPYTPLPLGEDAHRAGEGASASLVDPNNPQEIAEAVQKLLSDKALKDGIIAKGLENVKRFSWDKCAQEISAILTK